MKIPRLKSGPFCWTVEQWAKRMAFTDVVLGIVVIILCIVLYSFVDDESTTTEEDQDIVQVVKSIFIGIAVVFCIPILFAIILIIGLYSRNKKLVLIWRYYAMVGCVIFIILFIAASIFIFTRGSIIFGVILLIFGAMVSAQLAYSVAVAHTIYLNIKEEEIQTSYAQQS